MCVMLMLNPAINLWLMKQRYEYRYASVFLVTVLNSVLGTLAAVFAVIAASSANIAELPEVRIISSSAVSALVSVAIGASIFAAGRTLCNARYWGFAIKTGLPLVVHSVAKYVLDASDRVLIGIFIGASAVGIYGVLYTLSSVSLVFWSAINAALIPYMFDSLKAGKVEQVRSVASPLLVAYAVLCLLLMLLAPEIIALLAGEAYEEAVYLVPPIASGIFFTSLYNLYSNLLLYKERTSLVMCATVCAAVLNVALNIAFPAAIRIHRIRIRDARKLLPVDCSAVYLLRETRGLLCSGQSIELGPVSPTDCGGSVGECHVRRDILDSLRTLYDHFLGSNCEQKAVVSRRWEISEEVRIIQILRRFVSCAVLQRPNETLMKHMTDERAVSIFFDAGNYLWILKAVGLRDL